MSVMAKQGEIYAMHVAVAQDLMVLFTRQSQIFTLTTAILGDVWVSHVSSLLSFYRANAD